VLCCGVDARTSGADQISRAVSEMSERSRWISPPIDARDPSDNWSSRGVSLMASIR